MSVFRDGMAFSELDFVKIMIFFCVVVLALSSCLKLVTLVMGGLPASDRKTKNQYE